MNLGNPQQLISSPIDCQVLAALAGVSTKMSGRQVSRVTQLNQKSTYNSLTRLAETGLVSTERVGSSILYWLNREHVAAEIADQLRDLRHILLARIREQINSWEIKPVHASLFGSFARGDGNSASDVDIFLVCPQKVAENNEQWEEQVLQLSQRIENWSGNPTQIFDFSEDELAEMSGEQRPEVFDQIMVDGVSLYGEEPRNYLRR